MFTSAIANHLTIADAIRSIRSYHNVAHFLIEVPGAAVPAWCTQRPPFGPGELLFHEFHSLSADALVLVVGIDEDPA